MATPISTQTTSKRGAKIVTLVYPSQYTPNVNDIPELQDCVLLETLEENQKTQQWWIHQPYRGPFKIEFANHAYFDLLKTLVQKERARYNYQGFVTAALLAKDQQILAYEVLDTSKHLLTAPTEPTWWLKLQRDYNLGHELLARIKAEIPSILSRGLDIREALKYFIEIPTGTGYDLNPGNHPSNHAEARALFSYLGVENETDYDQALISPQQQAKVNLLRGATCYLYGHWWSCQDCSRKLHKAGISKLVICKTWVQEYLQLSPTGVTEHYQLDN